MNKNTIRSDQLYNWSDNEPFRFPCRTDSATSGPAQATATARTLYSAGFVDRTLQALWQTGLQVCPGSRAWPQVLSIGQPTRRSAPDGLCSGGVLSTGLRVPPQLPASASTAGADLQPQSRVVTAPDEVLSLKHKHGAFSIPARSGYGRDARRQLSAKLVASQPSPTKSRSAEPS
jgi:hypothetical protein